MSQAIDFNTRYAGSVHCVNAVFNELSTMGFTVVLNGIEYTHPDFSSLLRQSKDATSLMIRYAPDGIVGIGLPVKSYYVEVKTYKKSIYIEKDAYLNYMRISNNGGMVILICINSENTHKLWNFINCIQFVENKYIGNDWPIDSDGWMAPRLHRNWHNIKRHYSGSGTPYRCVNCNTLLQWHLFKDIVLQNISG